MSRVKAQALMERLESDILFSKYHSRKKFKEHHQLMN